jgi:hypothetical protein
VPGATGDERPLPPAFTGQCDDARVPSARPRLIAVVAGLPTSILAVVVLAASSGSRAALAAALLVVQLVLIAGWFRSAHLTTLGQASGALAAAAAAATADGVLLHDHDPATVRALAGVLAGLVILAFVIQLGRRDGRDRLTNALAASIATGALGIAAAVLLAVRGGPHGTTLVAVAVTGVAVGVLPIQRGVPLWAAVPGGIALGVGAGVLVSRAADAFGLGTGAVVALVAVVLAVGARAALARVPEGVVAWPVAATLPIVVVPPAVLVVARIMVG